MNAFEVAWLAGLTDGDGCVTTYWQTNGKDRVFRPIWRVQLNCLNTIKVVQRIVRELTGRNYKIQQYQPPGNCKLTYSIQVQRKAAALKLLEALEPFLVTKQEQARLVLGLLKYERNSRTNPHRYTPDIAALAARVIDKLKQLNFRGIPSQVPEMAKV